MITAEDLKNAGDYSLLLRVYLEEFPEVYDEKSFWVQIK